MVVEAVYDGIETAVEHSGQVEDILDKPRHSASGVFVNSVPEFTSSDLDTRNLNKISILDQLVKCLNKFRVTFKIRFGVRYREMVTLQFFILRFVSKEVCVEGELKILWFSETKSA